MDVDRDFLFGMLAVQLGFVDVAALDQLLRQPAAASATPLLERLRQNGLITAAQQTELESRFDQMQDPFSKTVAESNPSGAADPSAAADPNPATHPSPATPPSGSANSSRPAAVSGFDETIDSQVDRPPTSGFDETLSTDNINSADATLRDKYIELETVDWGSDSRSRYTLTREHGRGGLGCVWLARDSIMNREVALKEVLPEISKLKGRQKRLVREAQITGQLEHPNIVPVYELSAEQGGKNPFYTMRFLRGKTLGDRIRATIKKQRKGTADPLEQRELLTAFVSICHAIGYAHSRQIIHRDLKPSNVLLGDFGEVVVVDWGLAKSIADPADKDVDMDKIVFTNPDAYTCTPEGHALGTPAFMAPEQARGQMSATDELTDIYGLGSILFAIMTGKSPHVTTRPRKSKDSTRDLLYRICTLPTPRIRSVVPSAPAALDAICATAMARSRADRYKSAEALARDVQRWLADEPVSVYQESTSERMFRWLRRHRTVTLAVTLILLVTSIAGVTVALVTHNAKTRVATSLQAEHQAKGLALQQFRRAQDAIDRSLSGVSEVMSALPGTDDLRAELLRSAADDYEQLLRVDPTDSELRREAARTRVRLADLRRMMNDFSAAETQYRQAEQELKTLQGEFPDDPSWSLDLAQVWSKLALLYTAAGQHTNAEPVFAQAVQAYQQDYSDPALDAEAQLRLAGTRVNYAALLSDQGKIGEAEELLLTAEQEFQTLLSIDAGNPRAHENSRVREGLAMSQRDLANLLQASGRNQQATEKLRDAIIEYQRLIAADPRHAAYLEGLAHARMQLAGATRLLGDNSAPLRIYQSSVDDYTTLLKRRPGLPAYRESVAAGRVNIAQMLYKSTRSREAKVQLDEAAAELIDLAQQYPQVPRYRSAKAQCLITMAMVLRDLNEDQLTETAYEGGTNEFRWLVEDYPNVLAYRGDVGISLMGWARAKEKAGASEAAEVLYKESIRELTAVVEQGIEQVGYRDALAWSHFYLSELLANEDKSEAAQTHWAQALSIREGLPKLPEFQRALIRVLTETSLEHLRDPRRAVELAEGLCEQVGHNPNFRYSLAVAYLADGDGANAEHEAAAAAQLRGDSNPFDLFVLAIAEHHNGKADQAAKTLQRANECMAENCPGRIELIAWKKRAEDLIAAER